MFTTFPKGFPSSISSSSVHSHGKFLKWRTLDGGWVYRNCGWLETDDIPSCDPSYKIANSMNVIYKPNTLHQLLNFMHNIWITKAYTIIERCKILKAKVRFMTPAFLLIQFHWTTQFKSINSKMIQKVKEGILNRIVSRSTLQYWNGIQRNQTGKTDPSILKVNLVEEKVAIYQFRNNENSPGQVTLGGNEDLKLRTLTRK